MKDYFYHLQAIRCHLDDLTELKNLTKKKSHIAFLFFNIKLGFSPTDITSKKDTIKSPNS